MTDPEWAKKEYRREWLIKAITAGVLVALTVGVITIFQNRAQDTKITRVEHSACQEDASSDECQETKLEAAKAANLHVTCVPFLKAGYPCPKPGSAAARRKVAAALGGDASQPAPIAGQQPKPGKQPGGEEQEGGGKPKVRPPKKDTTAPVITPAETTEVATPSQSAPVTADPGASGETPASENSNGVKACVELAVSACADVGIPKLELR